VLLNHPDLLDRVKYSQRGVMTTDLLAGLFGIDNVLIGDAVNNTAQEGATDALGYIWGKNAILLHVAPAPGIRAVSAGYHFTLAGGRYIDRWTEQQNKGEFVRFNDYYDREFVATEAIYLIKNAVA
jgi:hypothetical protein